MKTQGKFKSKKRLKLHKISSDARLEISQFSIMIQDPALKLAYTMSLLKLLTAYFKHNGKFILSPEKISEHDKNSL